MDRTTFLACTAVAAITAATVTTASPAAAAPCAGCGPSEVRGAMVYTDTAGADRGSLHVRVLARHGTADDGPATATHGHVVVTLVGPGGRLVLRDREPIRGARRGHPSDHRMVVPPTDAARVLGPLGRRARVKVVVSAVAGSASGPGRTGHAFKGWHAPWHPPAPAPAGPPLPSIWRGPGASMSVSWTSWPPFRAYVDTILTGTGRPMPGSTWNPMWSTPPTPDEGLVAADGTFRLVTPTFPCNGVIVTTGRIPAPQGASIPPGGAEASWSWDRFGPSCTSGADAASFTRWP